MRAMTQSGAAMSTTDASTPPHAASTVRACDPPLVHESTERRDERDAHGDGLTERDRREHERSDHAQSEGDGE